MSDAGETRVEALVVAAAFAALSIVATYPLVQHLGNALPGDLGDPLLNAWIVGWDADRLRHGFAGLWDAPILFPNRHTLAYSEHLLGLAIFAAPIVWLTGNAIAGYNVVWIATYVLAGCGMYLLARELTGRRDAAFLAGLAFAFDPPRAAQLSHVQVLASGWMPITLWGLHRYFATRSVGALAIFAAAFTLQGLSNGYFLYFLAIPVALVIVYEMSRAAVSGTRIRAVTELASAGAIIVAALVPIALVYLSVRHDTGFERSYGEWKMFGADVKSYLSAGAGDRVWGRVLTVDAAPERQLFPGLTVTILSVISLWNGRSRRTFLYATIAAVGVLLSLGPEPAAWSHRILPVGPYLWLTRIVPGFNALRVPARLSAIVYVALGVLAAFGAARVLALASPRVRTSAALAIGAALFIEGLAAPVPLAAFDPRGRPGDRSAYHWLARQSPGGVLELPVHEWSIAPTLTYQYATLVHQHPIVNGYSGAGSALQAFLGARGSPLTELDRIGDSLELLQAIGVRYVIVHPADFEDPVFGALTAEAIRESRRHVADEYQFTGGIAFQLNDAPRPSVATSLGARIDSRALGVTASEAGDRVPRMIDGDPNTRWFIDRPQDGHEWIRIELDRPRDVGRVILVMASRSDRDYPRGLVIDGTNGVGSAVLFDGNILVPYGLSIAGFHAGGGPPEIALDLPPNLTRSLTLRQTGTSRNWWSVHELMLFER